MPPTGYKPDSKHLFSGTTAYISFLSVSLRQKVTKLKVAIIIIIRARTTAKIHFVPTLGEALTVLSTLHDMTILTFL